MEADPSILVFGHPRGKGKNAWNPIDLKMVPDQPKTSPKGSFQVYVGEDTVIQIGPEPRPFEMLRAADMAEISNEVLKKLNKL